MMKVRVTGEAIALDLAPSLVSFICKSTSRSISEKLMEIRQTLIAKEKDLHRIQDLL
jgi:hypothetical protein